MRAPLATFSQNLWADKLASYSCWRLKSDAVGDRSPTLSEVEVRRCRKSDAVGGPMLSEVDVRCCRRSDAVGDPKSALVGFHNSKFFTSL